jgi:hypothetical protein
MADIKKARALGIKDGNRVTDEHLQALFPRRPSIVCPKCGRPGNARFNSPRKGRELVGVDHAGEYHETSDGKDCYVVIYQSCNIENK